MTAVGIATDVIAQKYRSPKQTVMQRITGFFGNTQEKTAIATIVTATIVTEMIVTAMTEIETATLAKARRPADVRNLFYSSPHYIQTLLSRRSFKRSFTCLKG